MKKSILSSVVFIFLWYLNHGQNLVKNPSFENYIQCPLGAGFFNGYVQDWFAFTGANTSSYFNACAPLPDRVPENVFGYQFAKTGNGYACINVYSWSWDPDHRSYVEGSFINPLIKDTVYCISYFVSACDNTLGYVKNIDVKLSDTLLDWNNGIYYVLLNITPEIKSTQLLNDTINWIPVQDLYKARGGENYLTLGNFLNDAQTTVQSFQPGNPIRIDYYIDDVSVTPTNLLAPNLGNDTTICKNTLSYNLYAPVGYDSYQWSNGGTSNTITVNDSGTYWVKCIANGCGELSDTIHIGFIATPQLNLGNDTVICKGTPINLFAQQGFNSYLWNTTDTTQSINVSDSGLYIVEATDDCEVQIDSVHVSLDSLPNIIIDIGIDSTICYNGANVPLVLSTNSLLPNYTWSNGATSQQLTVTKKGWYWLQGNFTCGYIQSDSIFIDECEPDSVFGFYIPNSFTPNDDGLNDFFAPQFYKVTIENLKVFNRWGNIVYDDSNNLSWDGKFQNKDCPLGVYVYKISYRDLKNNYVEKLGRITLLR